MKNKILIIIAVISASLALISGVLLLILGAEKESNLKINLMTLSYEKDGKKSDLKVYTQDDFDNFVNDYQKNELPDIYITEFLFDGVGMYKPYDLDDFIESGNEVDVDALKTNVLNINNVGTYELVGDLEGMIAVNTNEKVGNIDIVLNGVNIDTKSKKIPAIYVYNKDITYTDAVVTIKTLENTVNNIEGGKLKKVSLISSDNYSVYTNKYSGSNSQYYSEYTNYYGIYTSSQIEKILFAKVTADREDLNDGDPYYFYKASGAISSDIDLYFEGLGTLNVKSKNKEGIETKGNLTFSGGTGDYVIESEDDCLNTTTDNTENANARNTLTINVNSLYAIVSNDADEGDAIDSNGELIINGGTIIAIAKPGMDAGLDSEKGTYINGGIVIATGDMYDQISTDSKQKYMVLSFGDMPQVDDVITLLDPNDNTIFSYKTDRTFTYLVYSSSSLVDGTYYLYKNGIVDGESKEGYYTKINSYEKGISLGYSSTGVGGPDNNPGMPNESNDQRPEMPTGEIPGIPDFNGNRPEFPNGETNPMWNMNYSSPINKEFVINGISNMFSGIGIYSE